MPIFRIWLKPRCLTMMHFDFFMAYVMQVAVKKKYLSIIFFLEINEKEPQREPPQQHKLLSFWILGLSIVYLSFRLRVCMCEFNWNRGAMHDTSFFMIGSLILKQFHMILQSLGVRPRLLSEGGREEDFLVWGVWGSVSNNSRSVSSRKGQILFCLLSLILEFVHQTLKGSSSYISINNQSLTASKELFFAVFINLESVIL